MFPSILLDALVALTLFTTSSLSLDNTSIRPRTVYQVLTDRFARTDLSTTAACATGTYCGGTWKGLASKLDYIQGMGFDTVWISPIVDNIDDWTVYGQAYHGYWTRNPDQLNSHFGTETDLINLAKALHARGMYLMVDVVVNHVGTTQALSSFNPNGAYGPLNASDFHEPTCWIDYSNATSVEFCSLGDTNVPLPDINTEKDSVVAYWNAWIKGIVTKYSIDAIRIDTVKHVRQSFWPGFTNAAGVFNFGEVFDGGASIVAAYQKQGVNPLNYPVWYPLVRVFKQIGGDLSDLLWNINAVDTSFNDPGLLGVFLNNHDNPRFENLTSDVALRKNAHAYAMVTDGVPVVYYGSEAGFSGGADPANREAFWTSKYSTTSTLYSFFKALNQARKAAGSQSGFYTSRMNATQISSNELLIAKSPLISVLSTRGSSGSSSSFTLTSAQTGWRANTSIKETLSNTTYKTDAKGSLSVKITNGNPLVMIAASLLVSDDSTTPVDAEPSVTTRNETSTASVSQTSITSEPSASTSSKAVIGGVALATGRCMQASRRWVKRVAR